MGLIVVLLRQVAVLPDLLLGQTAEGLIRHRLVQYFTPQQQPGKGKHILQFLTQCPCLTDAKKHFRLHPIQHSTPDDDRVILGNKYPFPQMGHLFRLFRQHCPGQGLIGVGLCLGSGQHPNVLLLQPVFCRRGQAILL